jgi:hypothetical protein
MAFVAIGFTATLGGDSTWNIRSCLNAIQRAGSTLHASTSTAKRKYSLVATVGIALDWRYEAFPDDHFAVAVQHMRQAKPGEHVIISVVPEGWHMELVKKGP